MQAHSLYLCLLLAPVALVRAQKDYNYPTLWDPATLVDSTVSPPPMLTAAAIQKAISQGLV